MTHTNCKKSKKLSHKSNNDKFHLRLVTPNWLTPTVGSPEGDFKLLSSLKSLSERL